MNLGVIFCRFLFLPDKWLMTFLFHKSVVTSFSSWACRLLIIYSLITTLIWTQLFLISRYFKLKPIYYRLFWTPAIKLFCFPWRHYLNTLVERIMVSYQNEAHLVHEFFFGHFPSHEFLSWHFPLQEFFWVSPLSRITFLMVRP